MKGKNLIMCGLCACIGFIGGEVRAYHKVLNELRTMERPKVTYMDYYDKRQRRVDRCVFQNRAEAEKVLEEMIKITGRSWESSATHQRRVLATRR